MANVVIILGVVLLMAGLAFLIPGIVGTAITGRIKHGPKAPRVLSIIAMVIGIVLCVLAFLVPICVILFNFR